MAAIERLVAWFAVPLQGAGANTEETVKEIGQIICTVHCSICA